MYLDIFDGNLDIFGGERWPLRFLATVPAQRPRPRGCRFGRQSVGFLPLEDACSGPGWQAHCPAHDDRNPSLSVGLGDGGRILVCCHAGCPTEAVVEALGLKLADLFPADGQGPTRPTDNGMTLAEETFETVSQAIAALDRSFRRFGCEGPTTGWMYLDADGQYVGAVLRYDLPDGKAIRPIHKGPDGHWRIGAMEPPRPLYNLPRLLKADPMVPIIVVEGEKAADALQRMLDLAKVQAVVTTSFGGAEAARKTDWKPLSGRQVILWPDHDEAGRKYASEVAGILHGLGCSVRVFDPGQRFPTLPAGFDAADAEKNPSALDCPDPADVARRLLAEAEPWKPKPSDNVVSQPAKAAALTALADVEAQAVAWLWPSRIPLGCVTLVCGRPGVGKSFLTCDLAARVSLGQKWPDGFENTSQGDVLLIAAEDDAGRTIRPRCEAAGADSRRIHVLAMPAFTLADLQALRASADQLPDLKLVILDPITHYLPGRTDLHRDNEVREALGGLAVWASERNLAVVLIAHNRKAASEYADDSVLGSRALSALPRAVHHVFFDPNAEGRRLFLPGKCNLAAPPSGLAFGIGGQPPRVQWERLPVNVRADDVIRMVRAASKPGPEAKARSAAEDWLRELLANGPLPTKQVQAEAKAAGLCWRTVRRAAATLGVRSRRKGGLAGAGTWVWALPDEPAR